MKKIFAILAIIFLISICCNAQTEEEIIAEKLLTKLKTELLDISQKQLKINDIAINDDGHWLILYEDVGYSFSYVDLELEKQLLDKNSKGVKLKQALLKGNSWVLLFSDNDFAQSGFDNTVVSVLNNCKSKNKNLNGIFLGDNGEILCLYATNGYVAKKCPKKMIDKLVLINNKQQKLRNAAFSSEGWILLYSDKSFCFYGIPSSLETFLKQCVKNNNKVNLVRIFHDKWFVVYNDYKIQTNVENE